MMQWDTALNVFSHIAFLPMIIYNIRAKRWHSVIINCMSVLAASPAYHLCYGGTWCLWPLRTMTRLDLFTSQAVVTDVLNSLVPHPIPFTEFLVLLAVWIVQAVFLLQTTANTTLLQYIVMGISVFPWIVYLIVFAAMHAGHPKKKKKKQKKKRRNGPTIVRHNDYEPLLPDDTVYYAVDAGYYADMESGRQPPSTEAQQNDPTLRPWPHVYPPYNYQRLWLGLWIGLIGIVFFRIHDFRHTLYYLTHAVWHMCVGIGGYFLLTASRPRGLGYIVPEEPAREWDDAHGSPWHSANPEDTWALIEDRVKNT